jgi:hypothetical protein
MGNGDYAEANALKNAVSDAREVARKLAHLGFQVFGGAEGSDEPVPFGKNLALQAVDATYGQFIAGVAPGDVALIYYAGHGLQVDDQNYLVPSDARLDSPEPLAALVPLRPLIERAALAAKSNGTVIVLLDSCRENPFSPPQLNQLAKNARSVAPGGAAESGFAVVDQGFATVKLRAGDDAARTFIAFATAPGDFAYDGSGDHSPFTAALLEHMGTRGLPLDELFARVGLDVMDCARQDAHFQDPWSESNLNRKFFFSPVSWRPVLELGLLGLLAGLVSCLLIFDEKAMLRNPLSHFWLWGVGIFFGTAVGYGVRRWGSGRWRDVVFAIVGSAVSFAVALTLLKAHPWTPAELEKTHLPNLRDVATRALYEPQIIALSIFAGVLFLLGMIVSYDPPRGVYRGAIWVGAVILGLASSLGLAAVQIYLANKEATVLAVSLLCVIAGVVFTAGTALACKPQRGRFQGFGAATGAVCVGLLMPAFFVVFMLIKNISFTGLSNGGLMYGLGALWFAVLGAQLGYCFAYYVPEHNRRFHVPTEQRS